ncbi:MAG: RDD family protein [marine bacterium B5-7]|nr:MAG: RDD family protein [marine bacterium B5-7]
MTNQNPLNTCTLLRRLAAIFYDCLLLTAVLFVATAILIPIIGGDAVESGNLAYTAFLLSISFLYFGWHWVKGGQTLGMRSWHVYVINESRQNPSWKQAALRFFSALLSLVLLGLGFVWSLFDKDKLALHDRLSKTRLIVSKN